MTDVSPREHWHTRAMQLVKLDCSLLKMVPWDNQDLSGLPSEVYSLVLKKLDELVTEACHAERRNVRPPDIELELAKSIWNFLKPWKQNETGDLFACALPTIGADKHV
jgi:hypothetical protein